ncbi:MAG TPA: T9SS type A sorting domain-containing protein, partial [Phaeodactylibacter sp.]|nr:T9SS type A sorting domain-containing protein [Phaeodactylibacter sp.]
KLIDASLFAFLPNVTQPNDFNDIQYGILAEGNCQIGMSYVRMDSIQEAGIDLESGWLRLRHSYMRSCQQDGIRVGNAVLVDINDLQVEMPDTESSIPRVGIGINEFSLNAKVEIFDYDFDGGVIPGTVSDGVVGIHLNREDNMGEGSTLSIKQSTFKFQAANSEGIILDGTFPPSSSTEIWLNYFEVSSIFGGNLNRSVAILTQGNKNNLSIKWNSFTSYDTEPKEHWNIGIWARTNFTGLNNKISINDFNGDIEMMQDNLFVQFFQNATIFNNTFRGGNFGVSQSTGALFEALCMGTDFKCNRFTFSGTNALRLASGAIVGEQIHKGNKWFNFSGAEPGNHVLCQADPENNIFEVHTLQSTCTYESLPCFSEFYPRRVTVTSGGNLFQTDLSGTPPSDCDTRSANHIVYIDTVDIKIAQGDYGAPGFDSAEVWMMERYLYQKLKNDTSLLSEHPSLPTFLSNNSSTTVGAFYELDQDIRAALKMNEPLNINTSQLLSEIDSLQLEVAEVDSIIAVSGWSTSLLQDKRDFIEDIQLRYKDYDSLRVAYNTGLATALQSAANDNQSIVTSHDYELNEKIVKGIYLQSLMNQGGQLTEDQIDSLLVIAGQSIDQGGPAGQYAFDLLPGCVKDSIGQQFLALRSSEQEPSAEVGENDSLTSDSEVGTKEREVYVYPNPSNGSRLTIKRHVSAPVQLLLIDLSGKTWMNQPKEGNMIQLAVPSSTPSGTYVLRLVGDKGYIVNKRLVILR